MAMTASASPALTHGEFERFQRPRRPEHAPVADREQEQQQGHDEGDVVEGQERHPGGPAARGVEDGHDVEVDGPRAGHRADADEHAGDEHARRGRPAPSLGASVRASPRAPSSRARRPAGGRP